jgi:hypothetical protein
MRRRFLVLCLDAVILMMFYCSPKKQEGGNAVPPLSFSMQTVSLNYQPTAGDSSRQAVVNFEYPLFSGKVAAVDSLNQLIKEILLSTTFSDSVGTTIKDAAQFFLDEYEYNQKEQPKFSERWELREEIKVVFQSASVVSLSVSEYTFTGGAHGDFSTVFYNVHPVSGRLLTLSDFIKPDGESKLEHLAEQKFRQTRQIPAEQSLTEAGYWFENDVFYLTDNMAVQEDGMLFLYNPYEIAPYSEGIIKLFLTNAELASIAGR